MSEEEVVFCPVCNQSCKKRGLKRHMTVAHKPEAKDIPKEIPVAEKVEASTYDEHSPGNPDDIGDEALYASRNPMDCPVEPEPSPITDSVVPPIPESPVRVFKGIPVGSVLELTGSVWWQHPTTLDWESAQADKVQVTVFCRDPNDDDFSLLCRTVGGNTVWSVLESQVIAGEFRVVKMGAVSVEETPDTDVEVHNEVPNDVAALDKYIDLHYEIAAARDKLAGLLTSQYNFYSEVEQHILQYGEEVEGQDGAPACVLKYNGYSLTATGSEIIVKDEK